MATKIATRAGCSRGYVSFVLSGKKAPSKKFLNALIEVISEEGELMMNMIAVLTVWEMVIAKAHAMRGKICDQTSEI